MREKDLNAGSQAYWQERWKTASNRYDASWPDVHARKLELKFIEGHLSEGQVLELGCGPFTIGESKELYERLKGRYVGVDSSLAAVEQARAAAGEGFTFSVVDLQDMILRLPDAPKKKPFSCVISRRVIQNLGGPARDRVLRLVAGMKHAVVIEGSRKGLEVTNRLRHRYSLAPLIEPAFNSYLNEAEEKIMLDAGFERIPFMSVYYYCTRGCRQLQGFNTPAHEDAYQNALNDCTGDLGPTMGFVK